MSTTAEVPPAILARVVERVRHHLYRLHQRLVPAPAAMMEMIIATWTSQAITVAIQHGVADTLAEGRCRSTSWRPGSARTRTPCAGCCGR